jgi:hypothetical protein
MKSVSGAAFAVAITAVYVSGCASIVSGTSQEIKVVTNPPGANCAFEREGSVIARVEQTPGGVTIKKTKHDITLKCNKDGYQETTYLNHSGADGSTFGNMVLGGGIGWAIDSASGADNKYDGVVNLTLTPNGAAPAPGSAAKPTALAPN